MSVIELVSETMRCHVAPEAGGSIMGLWRSEIPVLRSVSDAPYPPALDAGSYPLVPYSNRIDHGRFVWEGQAHALTASTVHPPHAIHGVGYQKPWRVRYQQDDMVVLALTHLADEHWPFSFEVTQQFLLSPTGLNLRMRIINLSDLTVPAGLGWHPNFVKRAGSHITFEANGRWEMGDDLLPTHRSASYGLDDDCASLAVDHCFDLWAGVVHLRDELLHSRISSDLNRLVVFTNPRQDIVAIEPVSHVNNALGLMTQTGVSADDLGLRLLAPGAVMNAEMNLIVENVQ